MRRREVIRFNPPTVECENSFEWLSSADEDDHLRYSAIFNIVSILIDFLQREKLMIFKPQDVYSNKIHTRCELDILDCDLWNLIQFELLRVLIYTFRKKNVARASSV